MGIFITAVPIFNEDMSTVMYRLHYQDIDKINGLDEYRLLDGIMNSPGLDMLDIIGIEAFTGGMPICVPYNIYNLLTDCVFRSKTPPELLILELTREVPVTKEYLDKCRKLKDAGYALALAGINLAIEAEPLYNMAEYVIVNHKANNFMRDLEGIIRKYPQKNVIISDITGVMTFNSLKNIRNAYFEGDFYAQPVKKPDKELSPLKVNAMNLLRLMGDEDFDLNEVSEIIQQDVSLSVSVLKFINSPAIGIRNKVSSIKNAIALLGQRETKKWIMASVSMYMAEDKPSEITKLALTRARFAENLATAFELGMHAPMLFMTGLFSLLDVILDKPMKEAVKEVSLNDKVKVALVDSKGEFADVMKLIYAYERADWSTAYYIMALRSVDPEKINKAFFDSLIWYRDLLAGLEVSKE